MSVTIEVEKINANVISFPRDVIEDSETREFKIKVVGNEFIVYPAHMKFFEIATPQQRANLLLERLAHTKPKEDEPQTSDEAFCRENMYGGE
jgi:hypothetical protein